MSYAELHCHSAFSFADGASSPDELALAAADLGHETLALTDHDGLWGSMEFAQACRNQGVRSITGAELTVRPPELPLPSPDYRGNCPPGAFHVTVLVENATGYRNLCRLLTSAHAEVRQVPSVPLPELERNSEGLVCLSGCARDGALAGRIARGEHGAAEAIGKRLAWAFGPDRFRVELQRPLWRGDRARNRDLVALAERLGVPCVATGNVHSHHRRRAALQDVLVAIRHNGTVESTEPERRGNGSSTLLDQERAARRFADHAEAVAESGRLAERLRFDLTRDLGYSYPGSEDGSADRRLSQACRARFGERYDGTPERAEADRQLEEELRVIAKLGLSGFFLLHRDLLELARDVAVEVRGPDSARSLLPPGRGRGSSVSSVVCYLTGLSHVDPIKAGLFLGRFLNEEITAMPDIDLDFPRDVRERLIPRIHERYGPERSALVAAFPTFRAKGAIRDIGKALGLPAGEIERVARAVSSYATYEPRDTPSEPDPNQARDGAAEVIDPELGIHPEIAEAIGERRAGSERWIALARLMEEAYGLPRHPSQHSGGMVLSTRPLIDLCPIVPAAMEGRQIVQWDKDSCADAGFLKVDLLGLGMLSAVERTVNEVARVRSERIDLSRIPLDDPEVYRQIQRAETTGVFQIESRAQMQMLPRSLPESIEDLTVQVALVRPGPIQGGAVHPYLERKRKLREDPDYRVPYEHPSLEPILSDTLGAIVFQDQVIQVAMALSGFSSGEAEGLRRAMSRKRSDEAMRSYRDRFVEGAVAQGVNREIGERVFEQIRGFSGFGFPKSHAAAFGLLAYQSTWLRVHFGPEFLCALLNEQPMGFYPPDALVHEAQRRGIAVRGPDVNRSFVECRVEVGGWRLEVGSPTEPVNESSLQPPASSLSVRIGLGYIKGLSARDAEVVVAAREGEGAYGDLGSLASRSGATRDGLERLAWAGACEAIGGAAAGSEDRRRTPLWRLGVAKGSVRQKGGEQLALPLEVPAAPALAVQTPWERVMADYGSQGISLDEHPLELLRPELEPGTVTCADLERIPDGTDLIVAGLLVARQRPATAKGVMFLLLEDESGVVNVIVLPPVYDRHRLTVRTASLVSVAGRLERREGVINVLATTVNRIERPDQPLAEVRSIEPEPQRETGRPLADLDAVLPAAHSFGRRGR